MSDDRSGETAFLHVGARGLEYFHLAHEFRWQDGEIEAAADVASGRAERIGQRVTIELYEGKPGRQATDGDRIALTPEPGDLHTSDPLQGFREVFRREFTNVLRRDDILNYIRVALGGNCSLQAALHTRDGDFLQHDRLFAPQLRCGAPRRALCLPGSGTGRGQQHARCRGYNTPFDTHSTSLKILCAAVCPDGLL